jgi:hypothetical protein
VDVNAYACQSADVAKALAALLEQAHVLVTHAQEKSETRSPKPEGNPKTEDAPNSPATADAPPSPGGEGRGEGEPSPTPAAKEEKAADADTTPAASPETAVAPPPVQPPSSLAAASVQPPATTPAPATPATSPTNGALQPEHKGEDLFFKIGDREYRVRGLNRRGRTGQFLLSGTL